MPSRANMWSKHDRMFWQEHAGNPRLALWHRVYAMAYGTHRENGHTPFSQGELALAVQLVDKTTGALSRPTYAQLSKAIATCVEYGFLDPRSCSSCLVVPRYAVTGGRLGSQWETCPQRHSGRGTFALSDKVQPEPLHSVTTPFALSDNTQAADLHKRGCSLESSQEPQPSKRTATTRDPEQEAS